MFDARSNIHGNADGLFVQTSQEISTTLLADLRARYDASATTRMGENHHVAAVPVVVVEKWMREGFNIYDSNVTPRDIVRRLRAEHLDHFIVSKRAV